MKKFLFWLGYRYVDNGLWLMGFDFDGEEFELVLKGVYKCMKRRGMTD